uniref:Olfactomedin like 2B n=1 Tax=Seriola lalandi dorsalis TaxID=1841481 RepID=A0A3B4YEK8_SERLL
SLIVWLLVLIFVLLRNDILQFYCSFRAEKTCRERNSTRVLLFQLLSDYDKVKTVSSGSDCVCRCIVRPIKRSDCSRLHDSDDVASPSQDFYTVETVAKGTDCKKCVCMAPPSAVNPCEGEYRFKKLQEASKDDIKLATIMDLLEGSLYGMDLLKLHSVTTKLLTRVDNMEKVRMLTHTNTHTHTHTHTHTQMCTEQDRNPEAHQREDGAAAASQRQEQRGHPGRDLLQGGGGELQGGGEREREEQTSPTHNPAPAPTVGRDYKDPPPRTASQPPKDPPTTTQQTTTATKPAPTATKPTPEPTTAKLATTSQQTTTPRTPPTTPVAQRNASASDTNIGAPTAAPPTAESVQGARMCKDTVASLSDPVQHNSYGQSEGAWMRDARGHGNVIYLTSGHYDNNLLEFRDMETFKSGQVSNTYKLPYSFTGTGHVVYNGAFYYNRAFSRDVIKYDLRHRYVAAWTTLHDAILEEQGKPIRVRLYGVEFAVDESGLWLLYPALDTEGFHQEVILLTHLRPRDLLPVRSFRTGLRRGHYGNSFLVCGVLYGVDSMERRYANVTYAFDTHTLTHTVPSLAFTNMHSHTSQLAYCPLDKKLYAWDNGHQMMYDVTFAY